MSESAARSVRGRAPAIDIEEFERRLRAPEPVRRDEDPLAELARLVGSANDPFKDMFAVTPQQVVPAQHAVPQLPANDAAYPVAPLAAAPAAPPANLNDDFEKALAALLPQEPARPVEAPQHYAPPASGSVQYSADYDESAAADALRRMAAQMRPGFDEAAQPAEPQLPLVDPSANYFEPPAAQPKLPQAQSEWDQAFPAAGPGQLAQWPEQPDAAPTAERPKAMMPPPPHLAAEKAAMSRKSILYMGSALVVVVLGIGATLATSGKSSRTGAVPTIAAPKEPLKVKPEETAAKAGREPRQVRQISVLNKPGTAEATPPKVVSREEQPVDLAQVPEAPRVPAQAKSLDLGRIADLSNRDSGRPVASVAPPRENIETRPAGYFPEPRKVRTVTVRPDGTVVGTQAAAAPAIPPSRPAPARGPSAAAQPVSAPVAAAQPNARPAAPKATARAAAAPAAPRGDAPAANAPARGAERARPAPERTAARREPPQPQRVASVQPAARSAGGGFAVQLAAPTSEAEARTTAARLRQKFGAQLAGRQPSIHPASVGGKKVWRIRVGGMSREDATALCSKLQGSGGSCFVARN